MGKEKICSRRLKAFNHKKGKAEIDLNSTTKNKKHASENLKRAFVKYVILDFSTKGCLESVIYLLTTNGSANCAAGSGRIDNYCDIHIDSLLKPRTSNLHASAKVHA